MTASLADPVPAATRCARCSRPARVRFYRPGRADPDRYCIPHGAALYHAAFGHNGLVAALRFGSTFTLPARPSRPTHA